LVPLIEDQKLGLMVWSPLAGGLLLSGKFGCPSMSDVADARQFAGCGEPNGAALLK
jgi:hypothetical protein